MKPDFKPDKLEYQKPELMELYMPSAAMGLCENGSGDQEQCDQGAGAFGEPPPPGP